MHAVAYVARGLAWQTKGNWIVPWPTMPTLFDSTRGTLSLTTSRPALARKGDAVRAIADLTDAIRIDPLPHSDMLGSGHVNLRQPRAALGRRKASRSRHRHFVRLSARAERRRRLRPAAARSLLPSTTPTMPSPTSTRRSASIRVAPTTDVSCAGVGMVRPVYGIYGRRFELAKRRSQAGDQRFHRSDPVGCQRTLSSHYARAPLLGTPRAIASAPIADLAEAARLDARQRREFAGRRLNSSIRDDTQINRRHVIARAALPHDIDPVSAGSTPNNRGRAGPPDRTPRRI